MGAEIQDSLTKPCQGIISHGYMRLPWQPWLVLALADRPHEPVEGLAAAPGRSGGLGRGFLWLFSGAEWSESQRSGPKTSKNDQKCSHFVGRRAAKVDDFDFSRVSFAQPVASSEDFEDAFLEDLRV